MAGPSLMVRILGDVTGLGKSFDDTASKSTSAATKMHTAFRGVLDQLNQSGVLGPFGAALGTADAALSQVIGHGKETGAVMMGVGGAVAGLGLALQAAGSKEQAAHQQLQAAVKATGHNYDEYADQVDKAIKGNERYGYTADQTQDALRKLTQATHDPQKALDDIGLAADLAAAKHEDLSTASGQLAKAMSGSGKILKEFGLQAKDTNGHLKSQDEIAKELSARLSGQASAAADTFTGKMRGIKAAVEDQVATFANKYGPAITTAGAAMTGLGAALEIMTALKDADVVATIAHTAATVAGTVATGAMTAAQWLLNAAMDANPIMLVVLALAALVAAIILAYQHVGWFRDIVDAMGRIAVAVFNGILDAGRAVFSWIANNWPLLLAILSGPFGIAAYLVISNWNSLLDFFKGIPGQIAGIASGMWDGMLHAFRAMVNGIIDIWNDLHFTLPKIDAGPIHIGGETIGVPRIPHLAQGGLITATGFVYAHAGEAITPAPGGVGGPLVHIDNASFASGVDVDSLMARVAWASRTARL